MSSLKLAFVAGVLALSARECSKPGHDHAATVAPEPAAAHAGHESAASAPSGYAAVTLDPARVASIGLATATVEEQDLTRRLRTVGVVTLDETRTAHVHAKVRGFIESIQADFVGQNLKRGAPLCAIYSQAVLAAELELVSLLRQRKTLAAVEAPALAGGDQPWDAIVDAARRRLMLWDVPRGQIEHLERTLEPSRTFTISTPRSGIVVSKQAIAGNYVEPGTELYVISDLAKLWVQVDLYEADVPWVTLGQEAKLSVEGVGEPIDAKVSFVAPTIDESTRTLKTRFDVDNPKSKLKPGAFVSAEMDLPLGRGLVVPENAVIHTGTRNIVFVVHGNHAEPREVKLGPLVGGKYRVDDGVSAGEEV
ncbi:MAG TPA: efflux RND transporter periplasmic adaptor subunit, partial [Minicystis sp.]|nr:efflux RND transporter periplasmic adaptor subunit [Minicystis sp.]